MMSKIDVNRIDTRKVEAAGSAAAAPRDTRAAPVQTELSEDDRSKYAFFAQVAEVADAMIVRHGKEFAIGTLVLAGATFAAAELPPMAYNRLAAATRACPPRGCRIGASSIHEEPSSRKKRALARPNE